MYLRDIRQMDEAKNAFDQFFHKYTVEVPNGDNGLGFFIYLYETLFLNKRAMFLERIHVDNFRFKTEDIEDEIRAFFTMNICNDACYLLEDLEVSMTFSKENYERFDVEKLKEVVETTVQTSLNGYLTSPEEKEHLFELYTTLLNSPPQTFSYSCDECGEHFDKVADLLTHLKETGHKDSIWRQYGWFEPKYY